MGGLSINSLLQKPLATQVSGTGRFYQETCKAWGQNSSLGLKGVKLPEGDLGIGDLPPALMVTAPLRVLQDKPRGSRRGIFRAFLSSNKVYHTPTPISHPFCPQGGSLGCRSVKAVTSLRPDTDTEAHGSIWKHRQPEGNSIKFPTEAGKVILYLMILAQILQW